MPGANYMGGKRNTTRAKLKDATSRAQKGFFCRQRLAEGLIADKTNDNGFAETKKKSEINLVHAKHNSAVNQHAKRIETNQDCHPEQTHTYDKDTQGQDRSAGGISEATQCVISLRSTCDRILAIPDLAGLHRNETLVNQRSLMEASHAEEINITSFASLSSPSQRTPQSWNSEIGMGEYAMHTTHPSLQLFPLYPSDKAGIFLDDDKSPRTPVSKYRISNYSPPLYRPSTTRSKGWSPEIVTRFSSSLYNDIEDLDTPGYPHLRNECGKSGAKLLGEGPFTPHDSTGRSINISRCYSGSDMCTRPRSLSMDTSAAFTWSESPQASPSAKALHRSMFASDQLEPLAGCIFDYEDPWDTIGIIMGLPRNESRSTSLEEELKILGASGRAFGNIPTSVDDFEADTLIERYSDSTSSTQFDSHEVKYTQESDVTWHRTSDEGIGFSSARWISQIDYVTRDLDEDAIAIPTQAHSPLLIQGPESPVDDAVTDEGCPYAEAESDHRIPSITPVFSPSHPECHLSPRPIDSSTIYYGPCLFSDDSDVESS